ncbi:hypothetical protein McPS_27330 [Marichromatium sp. PS1]|uniref:phosphatase PAP2 family protein n=1 Tax=Marichromatium sp. PS1 TaxID=3138932 RepID=UPI0032E7EF10
MSDWRTRLSMRLAARAGAESAALPGARRQWRWALGWLAVGGLLYLVCGYHAGFLRLNAAAALAPDWLWQWLTLFGDERVAFALALLFSWRRPRLFWALVLAALLAILYARGLKPLVDAARPPAVFGADVFNLIGPGHTRHSFPSGHSVTAGVFFGVLAVHARAWGWVWLGCALLVGASRVALGVHWPVDVAFGLAGGGLAALLGSWLAARWPGGATRPLPHLLLVGVAALLAVSLLLDNGGYAAATWPLRLIAVAALFSAVVGYLPVWRRGEINHEEVNHEGAKDAK